LERLEDFWNLLVLGGPVMIPIMLASLLAVAIFLERLFALRRDKVMPHKLMIGLHHLLGQGKLDEALALARKDVSPVGESLVAGLERAGEAKVTIREHMEEVGKRVAHRLEGPVNVLGVITTVSTLLGLLGTITGMIRVFRNLASAGFVDPGRLASGIWEALITTAAGLMVAIPCLLGYRYLVSRVEANVLEMEEEAFKVAEVIARKEEKP